MNNINALKKILAKPQKILLVGHQNPDGDSVGACLAMAHYLEKFGHTTKVVMPNEIPSFLRWLPGCKKTLNYELQTEKATPFITESTVLFILDFNDFSRVGKQMQPLLEDYQNEIVFIDHHHQPNIETLYAYSKPDAAATCEMIFDLIAILGDTAKIDKNIATCLYTGMMTDTGSFKFPLTSAHTHEIIAQLIQKGADNFLIHDRVYNKNLLYRLRLLGVALQNLVVMPHFHTAYTTLSKEDLVVFDMQKGDTEGFVNYALSLQAVYFAAIFIADIPKKIIKISFRSIGNFSVNDFARAHFQGGGHLNAAGAKSDKTMEETVAYFKNLLPQYQQKLQNSHDD